MAKKVKNGLKEIENIKVEVTPVVKEPVIEVVANKEVKYPGNTTRAFRS